MTSGSNCLHLNRPETDDARSICPAYQTTPAKLQHCRLSSQESRLPSGTVSKNSSRLRCSPVMPRPNERHSLVSTLLRRRTTNRSSVLQPCNRILCSHHQAVSSSVQQ